MVEENDQNQRRSSYGPTSPRIGSRGKQTRERIIAETLTLFVRQGFQDTTVHDIASSADVSRAALYQYFASKDEIVQELLAECVRELMQMIDGVGPLGPTREGFEQLRFLVQGWSAVHQRYGPLFVRWSGVDLPMGQVDPSRFEQQVEELLAQGGLAGLTPQDAARLVTAVVHRFVFLRFAEPRSYATSEAASDELATALQLVLFANTPRAVLTLGAAKPDGAPRVVAMLPRSSSRLDEVTTGLSARSSSTVLQILSSGAVAFAERGYHAANVDSIVREAGFARGTFYKYFSEKLDLLIVLAEAFEDVAVAHVRALAQIPADDSGAQQLRVWAIDLIQLRDQHLGVMRALIDLSPHDALLDASRNRFHDLLTEVLGGVVANSRAADLVTPWAAQIVMIGAIDQLPDPTRAVVDADHAAEVVATVIERGLLGG